MFWIALSALIMNLTGTGDDTFVLRKFLERARKAVESEVHHPVRQHAAIAVLDRTTAAFERHRQRVGKISRCVERLDRTYRVSAAEYERCLVDVEPAWDAAATDLIGIERAFREALTPEELARVRRAAQRE